MSLSVQRQLALIEAVNADHEAKQLWAACQEAAQHCIAIQCGLECGSREFAYRRFKAAQERFAKRAEQIKQGMRDAWDDRKIVVVGK